MYRIKIWDNISNILVGYIYLNKERCYDHICARYFMDHFGEYLSGTGYELRMEYKNEPIDEPNWEEIF